MIEVDPDDAVGLQLCRVGTEPVVKLAALNVDGCTATGEVAQPAGVVAVQVGDRNHVDLVEGEPDPFQRTLQRVAGAGREPHLHAGVAVEAAAQGRVPYECRVEPGVDQQPAPIHLQQQRRDGLT